MEVMLNRAKPITPPRNVSIFFDASKHTFFCQISRLILIQIWYNNGCAGFSRLGSSAVRALHS